MVKARSPGNFPGLPVLWGRWRTCLFMATFSFALNLRYRRYNIFWEMGNAVAFGPMGCLRIRPSHALFSHMLHLALIVLVLAGEL